MKKARPAANPFNRETLTREILTEWQDLLDTAARTLKVPAGLITRVDGAEIEIFLSSDTEGNPYKAGYKTQFPESGFYCEWAIKHRRALLIPNALKDPEWENNEAARHGMISYAGVPIANPDGSVFGTICFIDSKENAHDETALKMMNLFKRMIELSLHSVFSEMEIRSRDRLIHDLSALYPICSFCKKVRNEKGQWVEVEKYIRKISGTTPSHGVCPDCLEREMKSLRENHPDKK